MAKFLKLWKTRDMSASHWTLSKAGSVLDRSNTGIVGSNPARGIYTSAFSVLYCPVYAKALKWANPPEGILYKHLKGFTV
jgi:hypothetical protein